MNELLIKIFSKLFTLIEGRLSQNICKVGCVATIAGFLFSVACVEGPYMWRAILCGLTCLLLACFFGSMAMMYEEVCEEC
jgi:hypothetical protein